MAKIIVKKKLTADLTGQRFGYLVAMALVGTNKRGVPLWQCHCDCGSSKVLPRDKLQGDLVKSCGCKWKEMIGKANRRHGLTESREYAAWRSMKSRCENQRDRGYANYGGRGIRVAERWRVSFEAFLEDVGPCPGPRYSLDRADNDGNYEPGNVRWATWEEQGRNKRNSHFVEYEGERLTLTEWSERTGVPPRTIALRLKHKWAVKDALTRPVRHMRFTAKWHPAPVGSGHYWVLVNDHFEMVYVTESNGRQSVRMLGKNEEVSPTAFTGPWLPVKVPDIREAIRRLSPATILPAKITGVHEETA